MVARRADPARRWQTQTPGHHRARPGDGAETRGSRAAPRAHACRSARPRAQYVRRLARAGGLLRAVRGPSGGDRRCTEQPLGPGRGGVPLRTSAGRSSTPDRNAPRLRPRPAARPAVRAAGLAGRSGARSASVPGHPEDPALVPLLAEWQTRLARELDFLPSLLDARQRRRQAHGLVLAALHRRLLARIRPVGEDAAVRADLPPITRLWTAWRAAVASHRP